MSRKLTIFFAITTFLLLNGCMKMPEIPPLLAHCMTPATSSLLG
ncbi:hypothetical protein [Pseudomonas sp. B21-028]|nr:hypothetical protein [Pseudomonas sp. B21-028]